MDLERSTYREEQQAQTQIFYTPLRLRTIMRGAGLTIDQFSVFFCESATLVAEATRIYGLEDEDLVLYEFLVTAVKGPPR